ATGEHSSADELLAVAAAHERLVTWWFGVLAEGHRPRLQIRTVQESVHEPYRSADAGPVVVPQRRNQPRAIGGKHQVGQDTLPERSGVVRAPDSGLLRPGLDQHVMPSRIQGHHWRIREHNVIGTGVEISKPPRRWLRPRRPVEWQR